jgi:hypothetical protein
MPVDGEDVRRVLSWAGAIIQGDNRIDQYL